MEMDTRRLRSDRQSANAERKHVSNKSEKIARQTQKLEKSEPVIESRGSPPPEDHVTESKGLSRIGSGMEANSRVLRLASIVQYRTKRRVTTAARAGRSQHQGSALLATNS
jgi:hypothetical protein